MQTACALNNSDSIPLPSSFLPTLLMLYFAEMETHISRSFLVMIDGVVKSTVTTNYSASEATIQSHGPNGVEAPNGVELVGSNSALPPIINAYEYYGLVQSDRSATDPDDIDALDAIKRRFDIKEWISPDPCYLIPWDGIGCYDDFEYFEFNRISDLDLSGRNLTGSVPDDIGQLTSLVNMSLNNNHLTGPIPNLTNLSYTLERLYLQDNNLDGTLEWLYELTKLEELSLDNNHFTRPWPNLHSDIYYTLERLYLQNNNLDGTVEWLSELTNLKELSLGGNHLTGPMPNLANLTRLERLYLQNNRLNGTVEWLYELRNLKELNIENNNFSGAIPVQLLLNCSLKLRYSGNPYLRMDTRECNHTNNHENNDTNNHENNDTNNHKNKHTKLMVVLGILLFIALIVADQVVKLKIKREGVATESSEAKMEPEYSMVIVPNPTKSRAFTRDEIIAATQNFSRDIGRGGFGSVFFGILPDEKVIAVKVLSLFSRQGIHEFLNEVDILSKINHKNLVSLLGYCNETKEVMLIYEHMSRGSLRDHLYGSSAENSDLSWKRRLKIALDAAQGLEYLHVSCTPKIIHRDIKTANILLDSNFNGKLADFGLSKITIDGEATHVTTAVKGTFGYLDPEYYNTQMLTEKSDVYSFGVVLLEIICGRQPIDIKLPEEAVNIIRWVTPYLLELNENGGKIIEIIDKSLCGGYDMRSMTRVARIAMRCVEAAPSCRPSVSEVVAELKEAIKVEDKVSISVAEEIGAQNGDLLAGTADSTKREGMEWSDNSTNISKVGR